MKVRPNYFNTANAQENNYENNFMEMIEILKEEMKNFLKEIKERTTKKK